MKVTVPHSGNTAKILFPDFVSFLAASISNLVLVLQVLSSLISIAWHPIPFTDDPANTTGGDSGDDGHAHPDPVDWTEEKLLSLLDKIMDEDDQNGDGYVSFIEYMMAYSQEPNGQEPTGQEPTGQEPTGQEPTGQEPTGQEPTGQESDGQEPNGHGQEPSASAWALTAKQCN